MLRKISLAQLGLVVGGLLTIVGFGAYFADYATLNLAGFFYGIPLLLGGLALKAAEIKPIPFSIETNPEVLSLREHQATPTQNQVRQDITRYRYGQSAHLIDAIERLKLGGNDEEHPQLQALREAAIDGSYALILEFYSPLVSLSVWQEKQAQIARFFGPNLRVDVTQPEPDCIDVIMIAEAEG